MSPTVGSWKGSRQDDPAGEAGPGRWLKWGYTPPDPGRVAGQPETTSAKGPSKRDQPIVDRVLEGLKPAPSGSTWVPLEAGLGTSGRERVLPPCRDAGTCRKEGRTAGGPDGPSPPGAKGKNTVDGQGRQQHDQIRQDDRKEELRVGTEERTTGRTPDQPGRTVIIIGANMGIGFEAARALAGVGARLVLACRNENKGGAALERIQTLHPKAEVGPGILALPTLRAATGPHAWAGEYFGPRRYGDSL